MGLDGRGARRDDVDHLVERWQEQHACGLVVRIGAFAHGLFPDFLLQGGRSGKLASCRLDIGDFVIKTARDVA